MKKGSYWSEFMQNTQRVLFLQGPVGPFFYNLNLFLLKETDKTVFKINFNAGDAFYYPDNSDKTYSFYGAIDEFYDYLNSVIIENKIDAVVCFGDGRIYHQIARQYCSDHHCSFWAFEEGYLRPHYITFEKWGVNYSSKVIKECSISADSIVQSEENSPADKNSFHSFHPEPVASGFWRKAVMAIKYYCHMRWGKKKFPDYQHHRESRVHVYFAAWVLAGITSLTHHFKDKRIGKMIAQGELDPFFIFPLQVHNDNQIKQHGKGRNVSQYIRRVLNSFAKYAPLNTHLVIKHHPMDKGFSNYGSLISKLATRHGVTGRVHYVFDIPMPVFLRRAKGMVVVNSTSGISALIHGLPVKVIGDAHYDIPSITSQQTLADFWRKPQIPNMWRTGNYLNRLWEITQLNGSFYYPDLRVFDIKPVISDKKSLI